MSNLAFDQEHDTYIVPTIPNPTPKDFVWPAATDAVSSETTDSAPDSVWPEAPIDTDIAEMLQLELDAIKGLRAIQKLAHNTAVRRGWYHDPKTGERKSRDFPTVVALMHSKLSEALEADRMCLKDDKLPHRDGREVELADLILRVLDTAEELGLDIGGALVEKNRYNLKREDHDLKNRTQSGGKRY